MMNVLGLLLFAAVTMQSETPVESERPAREPVPVIVGIDLDPFDVPDTMWPYFVCIEDMHGNPVKLNGEISKLPFDDDPDCLKARNASRDLALKELDVSGDIRSPSERKSFVEKSLDEIQARSHLPTEEELNGILSERLGMPVAMPENDSDAPEQ